MVVYTNITLHFYARLLLFANRTDEKKLMHFGFKHTLISQGTMLPDAILRRSFVLTLKSCLLNSSPQDRHAAVELLPCATWYGKASSHTDDQLLSDGICFTETRIQSECAALHSTCTVAIDLPTAIGCFGEQTAVYVVPLVLKG